MKYAITTILISLSFSVVAMEKSFTLPDVNTLHQRLLDQGLTHHAIALSGLDTALAEQTMQFSQLPDAIDAVLRKYAGSDEQKHREEFVLNHTRQHIPKIVAAALHDHPEELKKLQQK